jgi:hypothetical protein
MSQGYEGSSEIVVPRVWKRLREGGIVVMAEMTVVVMFGCVQDCERTCTKMMAEMMVVVVPSSFRDCEGTCTKVVAEMMVVVMFDSIRGCRKVVFCVG